MQRGRASLRRLFVTQVLAIAFGLVVAGVAGALWLHTPLALNLRVCLQIGAAPVIGTGIGVAFKGRQRRRAAQRNRASH
jgi:hypothetical protein